MLYVWLILAGVFLLLEAMAPGLTVIWFAGGSLIAMILAMFDVSLTIQIVVFFVVSFILLWLFRDRALKKMNPRVVKTNADAVIGKHGVVRKTIKPLMPGEVFIYGKVWTATTKHEEEIKEGTEVLILGIEGVKLIVKPVEKKEEEE